MKWLKYCNDQKWLVRGDEVHTRHNIYVVGHTHCTQDVGVVWDESVAPPSPLDSERQAGGLSRRLYFFGKAPPAQDLLASAVF